MRDRSARFVVEGIRGEWWVQWGRRPVVVAGPYRRRELARYLAGLLNDILLREPLA